MPLNRLLIAVIVGPERLLWRVGGQAPQVWWRDDDARWPTLAFERLLDLSTRRAAPLTVAAVPDGDLAALAEACRATPGVELAIHGFRHQNRAAPGAPSGEINDQDRLEDVVSELGGAVSAFARAGTPATLFVPPWNSVHPTLSSALVGYGQARNASAAPPRLDAHLDVMRWKPRPRFRGAIRFLLRLRRLLAQRRRAQVWDEPIGLLTHHLDHDPAAWAFLEDFLTVFRPVASGDLR
jgi:hypothetical protein